MKRLPHTLLHTLTATSLLLSAATVVLWLPSYWLGFVVARHRGGSSTFFALHEGRFIYATVTPDRTHPLLAPDSVSAWRFGLQDYSHGVTWRHWRER